jgi:Golgi SNAP receptor complex protein 1
MQARKLEGELEVKIAAYGKLCSSYEGHYRGKGESGLATDQVGSTLRSLVWQLIR